MADDTARPIPTNNADDEPTNTVDKETNGGTGAEISKGDTGQANITRNGERKNAKDC